MNTTNKYPPIPREQAIEVIATIRKEWEEIAFDGGLVEAKGSVGLLLADVARSLELTMDEQILALGSNLYLEIEHPDAAYPNSIQPDIWIPESWLVEGSIIRSKER